MPIFERHAFAGFDKEVRELIATVDKMRTQSIELMGHFRQACQSTEENYQDAKLLDREINAGEIQADKQIYDIIVKYSPGGDEMRYILSMFKVAYIHERAADKIKNGVKRLCRIKQPVPPAITELLGKMADIDVQMLEMAPNLLNDYKEEDMTKMAEMKRTVSMYQKEAFLAANQISADTMSAQENADLLFVIKNMERVSDLMLDLAKVGHFIATGQKFERTH